jgi:hypothetical protein
VSEYDYSDADLGVDYGEEYSGPYYGDNAVDPVTAQAIAEEAATRAAAGMQAVVAQQMQQQSAAQEYAALTAAGEKADELLRARHGAAWDEASPYVSQYLQHGMPELIPADPAVLGNPTLLANRLERAWQLMAMDVQDKWNDEKKASDDAFFERIKSSHFSYSDWRARGGKID